MIQIITFRSKPVSVSGQWLPLQPLILPYFLLLNMMLYDMEYSGQFRSAVRMFRLYPKQDSCPTLLRGTVRKREIIDTVQVQLSRSQSTGVLSTPFWSQIKKHSIILVAMMKINSISVRARTPDLEN